MPLGDMPLARSVLHCFYPFVCCVFGTGAAEKELQSTSFGMARSLLKVCSEILTPIFANYHAVLLKMYVLVLKCRSWQESGHT